MYRFILLAFISTPALSFPFQVNLNYDIGPGAAHEVAASRRIAESPAVREAVKGAVLAGAGIATGKVLGPNIGTVVTGGVVGAYSSCDKREGSKGRR